MECFTGWRWNGAEWNRLELAKSGPVFQPMCRGKEGFCDSSAGVGAGAALPPDKGEICLPRGGVPFVFRAKGRARWKFPGQWGLSDVG